MCRILASLFCLVVFLCAVQAKAQDEASPVGSWYSEHWVWAGKPQTDFLRLSIAHLMDDGALYVSFYRCDDEGLTLLLTNSGSWSVDGDMLRTIYTHTNEQEQQVPVYKGYKIVEMNADVFSYTALDPPNFTYRNKRVDKDHEALCAELLF